MGHTLVIGASGMLRGFVGSLAADGERVTIIARKLAKLQELAEAHGTRIIHPVSIDYRNVSNLRNMISYVIEDWGQIDRSVSWIHDDAPPMSHFVLGAHTKGSYYHIFGSSAVDPSNQSMLTRWREHFHSLCPQLGYYQIILGFKHTHGEPSRWLTHGEISDGVSQALKCSASRFIVGTVSPWSHRPR